MWCITERAARGSLQKSVRNIHINQLFRLSQGPTFSIFSQANVRYLYTEQKIIHIFIQINYNFHLFTRLCTIRLFCRNIQNCSCPFCQDSGQNPAWTITPAFLYNIGERTISSVAINILLPHSPYTKIRALPSGRGPDLCLARNPFFGNVSESVGYRALFYIAAEL